jgi:uncharacterized protein (TIGR02466 family)
MQGELLQLFPTPVGKLKGRAPTDQENYFINNYLKDLQPNAGNKITVSKNVLDDPGLVNLKADLTSMVNEFYDMVYRPEEPINLYITTSWCNISFKGEFHHEHFHYNSLLSGTYYVEADLTDSIVFKRDPRDTLSLLTLPKEEELNPFNAASYTMHVDKYDVAIFPSLLTHLVDPLFRDGTRVSISFNTFAAGNFGSPNNLTQLTLR